MTRNTCVFVACAPDARAFERDELTNGAFTMVVLDALRQGDSDGNGHLSVEELSVHLYRNLPSLTGGKQVPRSRRGSAATCSPSASPKDDPMRPVTTLLSALGRLLVPPARAAEADAMTLPEAIEILSRERLAAEQGARLAKRHLPQGDAAALSRLESLYEDARQSFNSAIARLVAAIAETSEDDTLAVMEARFGEARRKRMAFTDAAKALVPPAEPGARSVIAAIVALATDAVFVGAIQWFFDRRAETDRLRRAQLTTRLDDQRWPPFRDISI